MIVSVGQLHSAHRLLELAAQSSLNSKDILGKIKTVAVCPADVVLNLCLRCGWLEAGAEGDLHLTQRGEAIYNRKFFEIRLREQLIDVVSLQPTWGKLIMYGRKELYRSAPEDISQCFKEAGMMVDIDKLDEALLSWWDNLAISVRGFRNAQALVVGRRGEKLSLQFEYDRTKKKPYWQAIDSNFSGYDVLSVVSDVDDTPMQIEVKASENKIDSAKIYITSNEWRNALSARSYVFHLWLFGAKNRLAVLTIDDVLEHIPANKGKGEWSSAEIGYRVFASKFQDIS